jgi:hypothetical protein
LLQDLTLAEIKTLKARQRVFSRDQSCARCRCRYTAKASAHCKAAHDSLMRLAHCGAPWLADNDMFGILTLEEYLDILINAKRVVGEFVRNMT